MTEVSVNNYIFWFIWGSTEPLFFALYDTHKPHPPTLSQSPSLVATISTRIRLISWGLLFYAISSAA